MISAQSQTDHLMRRLRAHAERIASQYGQHKARTNVRSDVNWRSASSLWPNFTKG